MRRLAYILVYITMAVAVLPANAQALTWARSLGSTGSVDPRGVVVDANGNVYSVGWFVGTADFDPGPGVFSVEAPSFRTVFVSKLDAAGVFQWVVTLEGGQQEAKDVTVDDAGNVHVVGGFILTTDFDPGPGTFELTAGIGGSEFIWKLSPDGKLIWARQLEVVCAQAVHVDGSGNVHVVGHFAGTDDFDPGPGVLQLASGGGFDAFVLKLDSAGNLVWARQLSGPDNLQSSNVKVGAGGDVYASGTVIGTADLDPGPGQFFLSSEDWFDGWILKLDAAGEFVWAGRIGGPSSDIPWGLGLDSAENVYVSGNFRESGDFDPGAGVLTLSAAGELDVFLTSLDRFGNFRWAHRLGGAGFDSTAGVSVDSDGDLYTVGTFADTVDFDPGPATFELSALNTIRSSFVWKLDSAGGFLTAFEFGGEDASTRDVHTGPDGTLHLQGRFFATVDFDPGPGVVQLTPVAEADLFVLKFADGADGATGACCLPQGECAITTEVACKGFYQGDGSDCASVDCTPPPVPTLSEWGLIATVLLLMTAGGATFGKFR